MKKFKFVGVSRLPNGTIKARFANDALRVKVLAKGGHTDIDLVELVTPLTKEEAVAKLIEMDFAKGRAEVQLALDSEVDKRAPKAANKQPKKTKEAKKPKKAPAKGPTLDSIMSKMAKPTKAELEDAPF
jgi:hypothetical protein